jgi:hypothetical protein
MLQALLCSVSGQNRSMTRTRPQILPVDLQAVLKANRGTNYMKSRRIKWFREAIAVVAS